MYAFAARANGRGNVGPRHTDTTITWSSEVGTTRSKWDSRGVVTCYSWHPERRSWKNSQPSLPNLRSNTARLSVASLYRPLFAHKISPAILMVAEKLHSQTSFPVWRRAISLRAGPAARLHRTWGWLSARARHLRFPGTLANLCQVPCSFVQPCSNNQ